MAKPITPTVVLTFPPWLALSPALPLLGWWLAARNDRARFFSADLCPMRLLPARFRAQFLDWASSSLAGAADDNRILFFVAFSVLYSDLFVSCFKRVLHFDSYRCAFNAETLKSLPRGGRTLALLFSSPTDVGLLPQSKCGAPSNKNIRAPCEAVALGTLRVSVNRTRGESQKGAPQCI